MNTVFILNDHPNLDQLFVPVIHELREAGVHVITCVCQAGRTDLLDAHHLPFVADLNASLDLFFRAPGDKLFLNAADQQFGAHRLAREVDARCHARGIPTLTLEHGSFAFAENWSADYLFDAGTMAVIGAAEYERFHALGAAPERLVITGCPKYDGYATLAGHTDRRALTTSIGLAGDTPYILFAGENHKFTELGFSPADWSAILGRLYTLLLERFPDCRLVIKPHPAEPFLGTLPLYEQAVPPELEKRIHMVDARAGLPELILGAKLVFTFSHSVMLEALLLSRPVIDCPGKHESAPVRDCRAAGAIPLVCPWTELPRALRETLKQSPSPAERRITLSEDFIHRYVHRLDGCAAKRIATIIGHLIRGRRPPTREGVLTDWYQHTWRDIFDRPGPTYPEMGFERYQRLRGVAEQTVISDVPRPSLLDVGSEDAGFRKLVPHTDYQNFEGIISGAEKSYLPFADGSFDLVTATDVLEHVLPADRRLFIRELVRVARRRVIISFPHESAAGAEQLVLALVRQNRWLEEHRDRGLPRDEEVDQILLDLDLPFYRTANSSLGTWVLSLILEHASLAHLHRELLNAFMQHHFYDTENRDPAYRVIYRIDLPEGDERTRLHERIVESRDHPPAPAVSIVMPLFNRLDRTRECLEHLIAHTPEDLFEIIFVDNASTDGTDRFMESLSGDMKLITNEKNLGFARACNQGAAIAAGEFIVFLNNDTLPREGWLTSLVEVAESRRDVAIAGSRLLFPDGTLQHAGVTIPPVHRFRGLPGDFAPALKPRELQVVTGACMLVRRKVFAGLGGFDEAFVNGCEDIDLCLRAGEEGHGVFYCPWSVLVHLEAQSAGREDHMVRNREILDERWKDRLSPDHDRLLEEDGFIRTDDTWTFHPERCAPTLSVIVPLVSGDHRLDECLHALADHSTVPREIILVHALDHVEYMPGRHTLPPSSLRTLQSPQGGYAAACRTGLAEARGAYVAICDPQCLVTPGWDRRLFLALDGRTGAAAPLLSDPDSEQWFGRQMPRHMLTDEDRLPRLVRRRNRGRMAPLRHLDPRCFMMRREDLRGFSEWERYLPRNENIIDVLAATLVSRGLELRLCCDTVVFVSGEDDSTSMPTMVTEPAGGEVAETTKTAVSIVIVTYNSRECVEKCLESLRAHTALPREIIIVDNASADGTGDYLQTLDDITLILNDTNRGYAAAANQGLRVSSGDFVILLNPDTVVSRDWDRNLAAHCGEGVGAVGPVSNHVAGLQKYQLYLDEPPRGEVIMHEVAAKLLERNRGKDVETRLLIGFCLMIPRPVLNRAGLLDGDLFLGSDDLEYSLRLRHLGYRLIVATDTLVYHRGQASFATEPEEKTARLTQQSQDTLQRKLEARYGPSPVPASEELWGMDWFRPSPRTIEPALSSLIILTCNNLELTRRCLETIEEHTPEPHELILVDNASTDGTPDFLAEYSSAREHVLFIRNFKNLGFAKGCNQGARAARGEFLVFLNNDMEARPGWLGPLLAARAEDIGIVGSRLLYPDGTLQHAGVVTTGTGVFAEHIYRGYAGDFAPALEPRDFQIVTAACLLIPRELFFELEGFDEAFVNGGEDIDLCLRVRQKGLRVRYEPRSVLVHHESKTAGRFTRARENLALLHRRWGAATERDIHRHLAADGETMEDIWPPGPTSIIILTLNQLDFTRRSLESVERHTPEAHELIIVDNGSTDGSREYLKDYATKHERVSLILNEENRGFAGGNNQGIERAAGDYLLFLNNDVVVTDGWLKGLLLRLESHPSSGMTGPVSNRVSGPQLAGPVPYGEDLCGMDDFAAAWMTEHAGEHEEILRLVGFCLLARREVIETIGGFDERYATGNFEDDDLCLRSRIAGWRHHIARDVFVHHYGSQTFKGENIPYDATLERNRGRFMTKWGHLVTFGTGGVYNLTMDADQQVNELIRWGEEEFSAANLRRAVLLFKRALMIAPDHTRVLNDLAVIQWELGDVASAVQILERALRRDPANHDAFTNLVQVITASGRRDLVSPDLPALLRPAFGREEGFAVLSG